MWAAPRDVSPAPGGEHCVAALVRKSSAVMPHGPLLVKLEGQLDLVERANKAHLADWEVSERARAFSQSMPYKGWCVVCTDDPLLRIGGLQPALSRPISCVCKRAF